MTPELGVLNRNYFHVLNDCLLFQPQSVVFFSPPVPVNAWLANPCLVTVFRAGFLSDVSHPQCSLYLVHRSGISRGLFMWFPVDKGFGLRSREATCWQIAFPCLAYLGLATSPKYFVVASPWAPCFLGDWLTMTSPSHALEHLGPS